MTTDPRTLVIYDAGTLTVTDDTGSPVLITRDPHAAVTALLDVLAPARCGECGGTERSHKAGGHAWVPVSTRRPRPVLDARHGAVDHRCSGCWRYAGLNDAGHEVYHCDSGAHSLVYPHANAEHECGPGCLAITGLAGDDTREGS